MKKLKKKKLVSLTHCLNQKSFLKKLKKRVDLKKVKQPQIKK